MGYRSEVAIVLYKKDYEDLISRAKKEIEYFGTGRCILDEPVKHFTRHDKEFVFLYYDRVKWYENFDEVQLVDEFLRVVDHAFVRIGEYPEDIQYGIKGDDFYDMLYIRSNIYIEDQDHVDMIPAEKFAEEE